MMDSNAVLEATRALPAAGEGTPRTSATPPRTATLRGQLRLWRARFSAQFARLYYLLFSHAFDREMRAVAQGRTLYFRQLASSGGNQALLRRNVHRLEKGLIMRPFRTPFARDYVLETARAFAALTAAHDAQYAEDLRWGADVLRSYFSAMGEQPGLIGEARLIFETALASGEMELRAPGGQVPYARGEAGTPIDYESFAALCRRRRSVRWYRDVPISRELVDRALDAAMQSPSACNRQSFAFRFFDDPAMVRAVAGIPAGTKGYGDSLPAIGVVIGRLRAYPEERDRHVIYIDGALAAMSFMLALETVGLSSCAINWPDVAVNDDRMRELLGLAPDERVVMLIGFGHADPQGLIPYSAKKPLAAVRQWN
jgi:nitroreductase